MELLRRIVNKRSETKDEKEVEAAGRFAMRIQKLRGEGELATSKDPEVTLEVVSIDISEIEITPEESRKVIGDLGPLVASIKNYGIQQPLKVSKIRGKARRYRLVFGKRRLMAAQQAGLGVVPCIVELSTRSDRLRMLYLAENLLRKPLTPIEEAETYQKMLGQDNLSKEELTKYLGCEIRVIEDSLNILNLPEEWRNLIAEDPALFTKGLLKELVSIFASSPKKGQRLFDLIKMRKVTTESEVKAVLPKL